MEAILFFKNYAVPIGAPGMIVATWKIGLTGRMDGLRRLEIWRELKLRKNLDLASKKGRK